LVATVVPRFAVAHYRPDKKAGRGQITARSAENSPSLWGLRGKFAVEAERNDE